MMIFASSSLKLYLSSLIGFLSNFFFTQTVTIVQIHSINELFQERSSLLFLQILKTGKKAQNEYTL